MWSGIYTDIDRYLFELETGQRREREKERETDRQRVREREWQND